ncbi:MAG: 2-hydroxyacid dehydrogenase [Gammaproteobacteria bacterium]|nr:2-hydroxyacid dehydrogenase [Gammaproteobacteria bacterium]
MRAVFLDTATLGPDIDLSPLTADGNDWVLYDTSEPAEVAARIREAEIVVSNKAILDADAIRAAKSLRYITVPATGTNNIALDVATTLNIPVSNCVAYGSASVVQHVFALILALATRLPDYHRAALDGRWAASPMFCLLDFPILELHGKTLGIIGYGELGKGVGRLAEAFGMRVLVANRPGKKTLDDDRLPLDELLKQSDIVTLHCPLTKDTENLLTAREFSLMPAHAFLINCARGGIVNENDLRDALINGVIGGAGVDVLSEEPPRHGNPLLSADIPNLIVTPHSAWASHESRQRVVQMTADNIAAFSRGQGLRIVNSVSPEKG